MPPKGRGRGRGAPPNQDAGSQSGWQGGGGQRGRGRSQGRGGPHTQQEGGSQHGWRGGGQRGQGHGQGGYGPPGRQEGEPYTRQERQPFSRQEGEPYARQERQPFSRQEGEPYARQERQSYSRQEGEPYARQERQSYSRQEGEPYARQERQPFSRQEGEPYARQEREPYSRQEHQPARGGRRPRGQQQQYQRRGPSPESRQQTQTTFRSPEPESPPETQYESEVGDLEKLGIELKQGLVLKTQFPRKPDKGRLGKEIRLISNCFSIQAPSGNVYHYDVEIVTKRRTTTAQVASTTPNVPTAQMDTKYRCMSTKRNREVVFAMLRGNDHFRGSFAAYDGKKNLYSRKPLSIDKDFKCNVVLEEGGDPNDPRGPRTDEFEVFVKPVQKKESNDNAISLDPLHALFAGRVSTVPQDAIMALETVLRHSPCMRYFPVGRNFYYPPNPRDVHPLGGGKEIWFGYHQSLRLGQWKPMVNLDISATTFYQKGPLLKYIADFLGTSDDRLHNIGPIRDADRKRISRELKNMQIETNHLPFYRRKYRILELTREPANRLGFTLTENGSQVRKIVADYFAEHYRPLEYPHLPCIQANPKTKQIYLPIEVCDMVEGQHCKKKLDEKQNAEMIKFTACPPRNRFNEIGDIFKRANYNQDEVLREFGMTVKNEPLKLEGRVLSAPSVRYRDETKITPRDGSWDMRELQFFRGSDLNSWVLLSFADPRYCNRGALDNFVNLFCRIGSTQGLTVARPANVEIVDSRHRSVEEILFNAKNRFKANLAIVVVPTFNNKSIYRDVKQAAETVLGLATQCVLEKNITDRKKCSPPLVSNLCLKINAKMGGVNNCLSTGEMPPIMKKPVIIIGADVNHPPPSADDKIRPSLAAVVGSLDYNPTRYAVAIRAQRNRDREKKSIEIILDLKNMVMEMLRAFYRHTNCKKPEKIIFYRDGVSEGQFETVQEKEVNSIREACKSIGTDYEPAITFIIVQKRHHTRFMPENDRLGVGRMRNIPPGTTVDTIVTHPLNFDFFLCSHFGLQGTSRPCHYTVIQDDNNFSADDLQKLTYYLCHTFVRCTKSISCPAPVMYAHLAAYRARMHLDNQMDESSASSTDTSASGVSSYEIPNMVRKAISVVDVLNDTMYFV